MKITRCHFEILFLAGAVLLLTPVLAMALSFSGGEQDGYDYVLGANATVVTIRSTANQSLSFGSTAAMSPLIISLEILKPGEEGIEEDTDLRVTIPESLGVIWDSGDVTAAIIGTGAGRMSTTVSYEDGSRTLVLDVETDFEPGESITVSGLSFLASGVVLDGVGRLELEIDNAGTTHGVDTMTITITAGTRVFGGGQDDGYDAILYDNANVYAWTGASDGLKWEETGNWDFGDGTPGNDGYPDGAGDRAVIDSSSHAIVTAGAVTVGELELADGFTGSLTLGGPLGVDASGGLGGALRVGAGTFDAADQTVDIAGDFEISGGTVLTGSGAWALGDAAGDRVTLSGGTWVIESDDTDTDLTLNAVVISATGGTVEFTGSGSTSFLSALGTYHHLTLNAAGETFTAAATLDVDGDLTITAGALDLETHNEDLAVGGDWTNAGTFLPATER